MAMTSRGITTEKARRAAAHPDRPGEQCRATPGRWHPVVDRARCEGKRDCVEVCPYEVFEVRRIDDADYAALSFFTRLKVLAHRKQARTMQCERLRSRGHHGHADAPSGARESLRRVHGALFVSHEHVANAPVHLGKLVVDVEDGAARIAEDGVGTFREQALEQDARTAHGFDCRCRRFLWSAGVVA